MDGTVRSTMTERARDEGLDDACGITQYGAPEVDIEQIEAMLANDPANEGLLDIAAFTYYSAGQLEKALLTYQRLLALDQRSPVYHYCLGNTYYRLHRDAEAYQEWHMTIRVDQEGGRYARRARKRLELVGAAGAGR